MNAKDIKDEFDEFAPFYNEVAIDELEYDAYLKIPQEMLQFDHPKMAKVLDLGCGTGLSSELFLEQDWSVTGIDLSPKMLKEAKKLSFEKLILHNLDKYPWPDLGDFDYIIALGTIEFIAEPLKFLKQCHELLKPGGILGVTFPFNSYSEATIPVKSFSLEEAQNLCLEADLSVKEICMFTGYRMPEEDIEYLGILVEKTSE